MRTNVSDERPLVSVVLPTYARPEALVEAVESITSQTYPNIELLVVDDASPTPAREVLEERSIDDIQWRCLRHDSNRGANAARNTGIRESNGEFVAFIDDDDRWHPEKIDVQVSMFRDGGDEVGVALVAQKVTYEGQETIVRVPEVGGDATPKLLEGKTGGTFSAIAVRRSVVDAAGLPDERFPSWQDREWLVRLSRHCEFAVDSRPLVLKRNGDHRQIGDGFEAKQNVSYPLFLEKHCELAAEYDLEQEFISSLTHILAVQGLQNHCHEEARRLALKTIRIDPGFSPAWLSLVLSLTTPRLYRSMARIRQSVVRFKRQFRREVL